MAGAAFRALTAHKDGPSLYDVCDPLLLKYQGGDTHLGQFYRTALGNPPLRALLRRTGLSELRDAPRLQLLREALIRARDDDKPDWTAIGQPVGFTVQTVDRARGPLLDVAAVRWSVVRRFATSAPAPPFNTIRSRTNPSPRSRTT